MRLVVLDMNFLQTEELQKLLQSEPETHYVLPDVALVEMCKHADWQLTMELALAELYKHSGRVKVSLSIGEALSMELGRLVPLRAGELLSEKFAETVANLIQMLQEDLSKVDCELEKKVISAREVLLKGELNASEAKARTETYLALLRKGLQPTVVKSLRAPGLRHEILVAFAYGTAHAFSWHDLTKNYGMSESNAMAYLEARPLILRHQFLVVRNCLVHIRNGLDVASYTASKELNNQLDFDYAITASYFDDLLSKDANLVKSYADLKKVVMTPSSELTTVANAWFAELGLDNS